ncbi:MAG: hypothetical protein D6698_15940 [Gammaproteobacteria bacterium]|nr:MAG: hypothetical protein D6698_15940 [Gammaproteobacteria bacterium]
MEQQTISGPTTAILVLHQGLCREIVVLLQALFIPTQEEPHASLLPATEETTAIPELSPAAALPAR